MLCAGLRLRKDRLFTFVTCPSNEVKKSIQRVMTSIFNKIQWKKKKSVHCVQKAKYCFGNLPPICLLGVADCIFQKVATEIVPILPLPIKRQTPVLLLNLSRICATNSVAEGMPCEFQV